MEERDLIPEIDPTLGLTDEQVQSRTPAGKPVYSGKSEKEIVLTHCFTFFNLIFVILAVMLIIGGSSPLNMGFLVVAVINTVIGIIQEIRAKRAVERLTLVAERPVAVIRSGTRQEVSPEAVVKDDIAEFASGDTLPADGILRSGEMWVDESLLTGEADAVTKTPGDEVKSGSAILSGRGRVQFTAVGGDSFAAQLSREAQKNPGAKKSEMMRSLDRLILFVGIALVPVGIILFYQEFCVLKLGLESSVEGTVAALVGMIPEGLYLLTSIAMAASAVKLSRKKVLVQDMNCIETLARVDVLCVDKTGTITEPDMEVENVVPLSDGNPEYLEAVLTAMYGASEPDNATGRAIHELFDGETDWVCEKRIPFSPETKWSGAVFAGQGAFLVGAPEFILAQRYEEYRDTVDGWAEQGCRVLLAARYDGDPVPGALDPALVTPLALILLSGRIREQAAETFGYFDRQGVTVKVISGDNPHTASLIAARAGIPGADRYIDTSALETDEDFSHAVCGKHGFRPGDAGKEALLGGGAAKAGAHRGHDRRRRQRSACHEAGGLLHCLQFRRAGCQPAGQSRAAEQRLCRHARHRRGGAAGHQQHSEGGDAVPCEEYFLPVPVGDLPVHGLAVPLAAHAPDRDLRADHRHSLVFPRHGAELRPGDRAFPPGGSAPGVSRRADQCIRRAGVSGVYGGF